MILLISVVLCVGLITERRVLQSVMKREINFKNFVSLGDLKLGKMEKLEKRNFSKSDTVGTELIENGLKMIKDNSTGDHHKKGKKRSHTKKVDELCKCTRQELQ